jgi:hypothetical protein
MEPAHRVATGPASCRSLRPSACPKGDSSGVCKANIMVWGEAGSLILGGTCVRS